MADGNDLKNLELRIAELEKKLGSMTRRSTPANISEEEVKAYQKVRDVLAADYGDFCGINDCFRCGINNCIHLCKLCNLCHFCINECNCGPCSGYSYGGISGGGLSRFSGIGG
jgi:hypothetical protein